MSRATYQEPIRRSTTLPAFSQDLASVHFHPHADFATLQVFTCDRLSCVLTKEACAANYTRTNAPISCKGCPIGAAHAGGQRYRNESGIHTASELALGLSCVRCERNEHTATRFTARFRLVRNHTLCISCVNREYECVKGKNSKGATPVRWAHLKQATVTIQDAAGDWKTLDIGLRADRAECERYVERIHPGYVLVEVFMGGHAVQPGAPDRTPTAWQSERTRKGRATIAACKQKVLPAASNREAARNIDASRATAAKPVDWDDWDTPLYAKAAPSDESDSDGSGQARRRGWLPPLSEEEDAAYRASFEEGDANERFLARNGYYGERSMLDDALDPEFIAAYWDLTADGLPDFIEWLCEGWTEPAEPSATVSDAVALPGVADSAVSDSVPVAEAVGSTDTPDEDEPSAWEGCYIERDGVTTYVCDYAKERGISSEEAAIVLGMCDPEYTDEPEPEAVSAPEPEPAPEPVKAEPEPKKLTGKQLRKLEKAQRRAERHQGEPQPAPNRMPAKQTAIAARAYALLQAGK